MNKLECVNHSCVIISNKNISLAMDPWIEGSVFNNSWNLLVKTPNYLSENLKKDGILIIDFLNSKKVIDNLVKEETKEIDGVQFNISRKFEDGFIIKNIEVNHDKENMFFHEKVKALTKENFSDLLTFAGLQIISTFGNYKLDEFNPQTSDRLIIITKK